jgi:hypothetical protein
MDTLYKLVRNMRQDTFFEFTRQVLDTPGRTVELDVLGRRLLMTDHVDNIKAVQFTQVKKDSVPTRTRLTMFAVFRLWQRGEDP